MFKARLSFTVILELDSYEASSGSEMHQIAQEYEAMMLSNHWHASEAPQQVQAVKETLYMSKIEVAEAKGLTKLA